MANKTPTTHKPRYKHTPLGWIPEEWEVKELGDVIINSYSGGTPSRNIKKYYENGTIPWIKSGEINQIFVNETEEYITEEALKNSSAKITPKGTLLYALYGATAGVVGFTNIDAALNQAILAIFPNDKELTKQFLFNFLSFNKDNILLEFTQGGQPNLSAGLVKSLKILLPPIKAQNSINDFISTWDKAISITTRLITQKEKRKKWLMQQLLTGKKRLKGFSGGWNKVKLESVSDIRRGASPRPIQDPKWFSETGRGWIRISDVTSSNFYLNQTTQYLSNEGADKSVKVDKGDLIMSICATIGVPVIVNIPACIHDGFVLFREYEKNLTTFFLYYFIQYITEKLSGEGQPGTQKNLNTSIVGNIQLNLPKIEEQTAITSVLQSADKEIQILKTKLEKLKTQKKGLMQVLLTGKVRVKI